jgi:hypothetical protein
LAKGRYVFSPAPPASGERGVSGPRPRAARRRSC